MWGNVKPEEEEVVVFVGVRWCISPAEILNHECAGVSPSEMTLWIFVTILLEDDLEPMMYGNFRM